MTIRNRLIASAFLSSAFVAGAAAVSTAFLFVAASQLEFIRTAHLPSMNSNTRIVDSASSLALSLDDYAEATAAGDNHGAASARAKADEEFKRLERVVQSAETDLQQAGQPLHAERLAQYRALRSQVDSLAQEWRRIELTTLVQVEHSEADDLDDRAMALVVGVVSFQDQASKGIAAAITKADSNIRSVCQLSIAVAAAMTLITLSTGMMFATNLARRLTRVKEQARKVGSGQLETMIEIEGKDEIDEIAMSFNEMVGELRGSRTKLEHDARYDPLTALPNRAHFLAKLSERLTTGERTLDFHYALCFIDVDHFKYVNDTFGHAAGDELLRSVARHLQAVADGAGTTRSTVARLGGDEFTILFESVAACDLNGLGERLRSINAVPIDLEGKSVTVTLSIGIALGSDSITSAALILGRADAALYHSKRNGRNAFTIYSGSLVPVVKQTSFRTNRDGVSGEAA